MDGILFEIFFDTNGKRRQELKKRYFDEVFELQVYGDLKESFDFIAESLTATGGEFYAVPGKGHDLAVTVATKKQKDAIVVEAIYVGGLDVLRIKEEWIGDDGKVSYGSTDPDRLNGNLSEQLIVPARLLKVSYTPKDAGSADSLVIPRG